MEFVVFTVKNLGGMYNIETNDSRWMDLNRCYVAKGDVTEKCNDITYWCKTTVGKLPTQAFFIFV